MNGTSDLKDRVLESSRTYFGEAERGEGLMGRTWSGSAESRPRYKPRWEGVSPISGVASAAWDGWPGRGIPELASPLAD